MYHKIIINKFGQSKMIKIFVYMKSKYFYLFLRAYKLIEETIPIDHETSPMMQLYKQEHWQHLLVTAFESQKMKIQTQNTAPIEGKTM